MATIKIIHCADLHIGARESLLGEKADMRRTEALLTFEKIAETARQNNVELCLIAGDLLHGNKTERSFIERIFDSIKSTPQTKFVFSAGNHDPLNSESPFFKAELPENLIVMPEKDSVFEIKDKVKVYGKSFCEIINKGEDSFSVAADESCINIMCIHGEYGTNSGRNPITDKFIADSGMDYIALGHIHKRSDIEKRGNTFFAYCGCAEGQGFDETGEKGIYMGEIGKGICDLSFIPVCRRIHICESVEVNGLGSSAEICSRILGSLLEKYGEDYEKNIYKITLTGVLEENAEINIADISARLMQSLYFACVIDDTRLEFNLEALKNEVSLKGIFVTKMLQRIEDNPENAKALTEALKIGLKAFNGEG